MLLLTETARSLIGQTATGRRLKMNSQHPNAPMSSNIGISNNDFTAGMGPYLLIQTSWACVNCKRPCKYCEGSDTVDSGTSIDSTISRTIATDTTDLSSTNVDLADNFSFKGGDSEIKARCGINSPTGENDHLLNSDNENKILTPDDPKKKNKKFDCCICSKSFKTHRGLKDHEAVHTGARDHKCDLCGKGYSTKANLLIHKRTHEGKKLFSCCICEKSFHKKDTLKVHFRNHTGEKPYACDQCPMTFIRKCILQNHQLVHESVKRFICSVCGKRFTTISGLKYHEGTHTGSGEKRIRKPAAKPNANDSKSVLCQLCGKIYSSMSNFRSHELVHKGQKPYKCQTCHRVYAKKDSLRIHQRTHSELRLYACHLCDYSAYRNGTLKSHILRHTGVRPYSCPQCPQTFTQTSSLSYHLKHHERVAVKLLAASQQDLENVEIKNEFPELEPQVIVDVNDEKENQ